MLTFAILLIFSYIAKSKNALSSQVSKAMRGAIIGEYPDLRLDYSKVQVAEGKLQITNDISLTTDKENDTLLFSWDPKLEYTSQPGKGDDQVNIVYLNQKEKIARNLLNVANREDGKAIIDLKEERGYNCN